MDITELLILSLQKKASDLHLSAGLPPMMRVDGEIQCIHSSVLDHQMVETWILNIMNESQKQHYQTSLEMDFAFELQALARYRVNVFKQNRGVAAAFRIIPPQVLTLEELKLPAILPNICAIPHGLVLVTGATGSGKSTTLAAMLDYINNTKNVHIITLEDPIEFVHPCKKAIIHQREIPIHTQDFANGLRSALREDPDVIFIGELRDLETIRLALTAAETGHLVLATLHTSSASKAIDRIVSVFPAQEKEMIRWMLSESLQAVISQVLIKKQGGGRVAAHEIMICNFAIRNLIRENKIAQIYSAIQTGQAMGMQTLEQALKRLVDAGEVQEEEACRSATYKKV